jgi:hypothetical protein
MEQRMPIYLENATYQALVAALRDLPVDPVTGKMEADAIKIALGEVADIWPRSIEAEAKAA